jgi:hypothetical protein
MGNAATTETMSEEINESTQQELTEVEPEVVATNDTHDEVTGDEMDKRMLAAWMEKTVPAENRNEQLSELADKIVDLFPKTEGVKQRVIYTPGPFNMETYLETHKRAVTNNTNSVVTVDLLDFTARFACPMCLANGQTVMINLNTMVEHARSHKNESDTDDESEYSDDESEYSDEEDENERELNAAIEKETNDVNAAIRESAMESEIMGNMNEDDALAAALALSNEEIPKLTTRFGSVVITPNEADTIDCNDVNCD